MNRSDLFSRKGSSILSIQGLLWSSPLLEEKLVPAISRNKSHCEAIFGSAAVRATHVAFLFFQLIAGNMLQEIDKYENGEYNVYVGLAYSPATKSAAIFERSARREAEFWRYVNYKPGS